jgi:transposase
LTVHTIAGLLRTRPARVSKWRQRFIAGRVKGLDDAPRVGAPKKYAPETARNVMSLLSDEPPSGAPRWSGSLLAERLGVGVHQVWRILREQGIRLDRTWPSWINSETPGPP